METIIVLLNPGKMGNPDLDLRYEIPDRLEEAVSGRIQDNGYDYVDAAEGEPGPLLGIWLKTESAEENWPLVEKLFREETFKGNDLSKSAEIYISKEDTAELGNCVRVFPGRT